MSNTYFRDYLREHLNESKVVKGIPAVIIHNAYDLPSLIKLFNRDAQKVFGKSVDLKKCKFEEVQYKIVDNISKLSMRSRIEKPRAFIVSRDMGEENDELVSYCIFSGKSRISEFTCADPDDFQDYSSDFEVFMGYAKLNSAELYEIIVD